MKIQLALDLDLFSGAYSLRVDSSTHPGAAIDADTLKTLVARVMDNMAARELAPPRLPFGASPPHVLN